MLAIQCCRAFSTACIALAEQSRAEYIPITNRPPQFGVCCAPVRLGTTTLANYIAQNYLSCQRTYTTTPQHTSKPGTSSQLQRPATHGRVCAFESRCCSYFGTRCERLANLNQAHRKKSSVIVRSSTATPHAWASSSPNLGETRRSAFRRAIRAWRIRDMRELCTSVIIGVLRQQQLLHAQRRPQATVNRIIRKRCTRGGHQWRVLCVVRVFVCVYVARSTTRVGQHFFAVPSSRPKKVHTHTHTQYCN